MPEQLSFLADFSTQINNVPEGSSVEINVINVPNGES